MRRCLLVRKLEMFADVTSKWLGKVVESDDLSALLGQFVGGGWWPVHFVGVAGRIREGLIAGKEVGR